MRDDTNAQIGKVWIIWIKVLKNFEENNNLILKKLKKG